MLKRYYRDIIPTVQNSALPVMTKQEANVLFVVWKDKQSNRSRGMSNVEIQEALRKSTSPGSDEGTSIPNIKKILQKLREWQPTPLLLAFKAGRERKIYRLPKDTMVTWPASARLLLLLESDSRGTVERKVFAQRTVLLQMKNPDTGEAFTAEEIDQQIDYCRDRHFPYIEEDSKGFIRATDRVLREQAFLEKIDEYQRSLELNASA